MGRIYVVGTAIVFTILLGLLWLVGHTVERMQFNNDREQIPYVPFWEGIQQQQQRLDQ